MSQTAEGNQWTAMLKGTFLDRRAAHSQARLPACLHSASPAAALSMGVSITHFTVKENRCAGPAVCLRARSKQAAEMGFRRVLPYRNLRHELTILHCERKWEATPRSTRLGSRLASRRRAGQESWGHTTVYQRAGRRT